MLYTEAYDREYGIFYNVPNEDEEGNEIDAIEMPLVALHWSEDTSVDSPLYESLRSFIRFKVHETTGMTWKELLSLPNDLYEHTLQTCKEKFDADEAKRKQEAEEANKHFQQQTGILGANGLPMGLNLP